MCLIEKISVYKLFKEKNKNISLLKIAIHFSYIHKYIYVMDPSDPLKRIYIYIYILYIHIYIYFLFLIIYIFIYFIIVVVIFVVGVAFF